MQQTFMQESTHQRLDQISEKATSLLNYAQRCRKLVDRGLADDTEGLRAYEVIAQYGELMAMQASLIRAQADAMAQHLRTLKP